MNYDVTHCAIFSSSLILHLPYCHISPSALMSRRSKYSPEKNHSVKAREANVRHSKCAAQKSSRYTRGEEVIIDKLRTHMVTSPIHNFIYITHCIRIHTNSVCFIIPLVRWLQWYDSTRMPGFLPLHSHVRIRPEWQTLQKKSRRSAIQQSFATGGSTND
jgi:hypothetical protein